MFLSAASQGRFGESCCLFGYSGSCSSGGLQIWWPWRLSLSGGHCLGSASTRIAIACVVTYLVWNILGEYKQRIFKLKTNWWRTSPFLGKEAVNCSCLAFFFWKLIEGRGLLYLIDTGGTKRQREEKKRRKERKSYYLQPGRSHGKQIKRKDLNIEFVSPLQELISQLGWSRSPKFDVLGHLM